MALSHPLISPTLAESSAGAPPMDGSCGEKMIVDSYRLKCCEARTQGVLQYGVNLQVTDTALTFPGAVVSTPSACVTQHDYLVTSGPG